MEAGEERTRPSSNLSSRGMRAVTGEVERVGRLAAALLRRVKDADRDEPAPCPRERTLVGLKTAPDICEDVALRNRMMTGKRNASAKVTEPVQDERCDRLCIGSLWDEVTEIELLVDRTKIEDRSQGVGHMCLRSGRYHVRQTCVWHVRDRRCMIRRGWYGDLPDRRHGKRSSLQHMVPKIRRVDDRTAARAR